MERSEIVAIYKKRYNKTLTCSYGAFMDNWSKYGWTIAYPILKNKLKILIS
jgi:hypothetical protein